MIRAVCTQRFQTIELKVENKWQAIRRMRDLGIKEFQEGYQGPDPWSFVLCCATCARDSGVFKFCSEQCFIESRKKDPS